MRKVFFVFILFLAFFTTLKASWVTLPFPGINRFYALNMIDDNKGFLSSTTGHSSVNCEGKISITENGGNSWRTVITDSIIIYAISIQGAVGYAVGVNSNDYTGVIYITSDFGESWVKNSLTNAIGFTDVIQVATKVYIGCFDRNLYASSDQGISWEINSTFSSSVFALTKNTNNLYVVSQNKLFVQSQAGWEDLGFYGIWGWERGVAVDPTNSDFYIGGFNYQATIACISSSTDQGASWKVDTLEGEGFVKSIAFNSRGDGYAVGIIDTSNNYMYQSVIWKKLGNNWIMDLDFNDLGFQDIVATEHSFYAVGVLGLYKTDIPTSVPDQSLKPSDYQLKQNFPNPFNPTTTISFSIPTKSKVTLSIFDVTGKKLQTLINEQKSPGNYEVEFNGSNLSSGTYFYKFEVGGIIETKKMILLK